MSRTRRMTTAAAAALAAVLGVGVTTAQIGATTALWQDQVTIPGVTIVAGPTSEPPIVIEPENPLDPIELPPGHEHQLAFYYTATLDLSRYELPVILEMDHGWPTVTGNVTNIQGNQTEYWVIQDGEQSPPQSFRKQMNSVSERAQTWHNFYREGEAPPQNDYPGTAVPADATEIKVRFKVHAVHYDYDNDATFRLSDGGGLASFYRPDTNAQPTGDPLFQVPYTLPDLYWDAAAADGAVARAAEQQATEPSAGTTPDAQQPAADPAAPTPEPAPTDSTGPTTADATTDVAPTGDEDLGGST